MGGAGEGDPDDQSQTGSTLKVPTPDSDLALVSTALAGGSLPALADGKRSKAKERYHAHRCQVLGAAHLFCDTYACSSAWPSHPGGLKGPDNVGQWALSEDTAP